MWLQVLWRLRRPIGRGAKWVGLAALIMLAFTLLTRESGREWLLSRLQSLGAPVYRTQPSPVVIVERLQAMQRLETARQTTLHDVAVEATNGLPVWLAGERLRMRIVAGSLRRDRPRQAASRACASLKGRVRLILPEPQLFEITLREGSAEVYHRERGWLVFRPDATIEQRARAQAWLEARQAALQGELLAKARQNAAREITRLLELLGFEQAQVGWQTAQAN
jgi:hypothetical protein